MNSMETTDKELKSTELLVEDDAGKLVAADQRRRRLVRGAVAFAPLVLTLRSGALAAASCTGAKVIDFDNSNTTLPTPISGAEAGDYCVSGYNTCQVGDHVKIQTLPPPSNSQPVVPAGVDSQGNITAYGCSIQGTVAIVSSGAHSSLYPP